MNLKNYTSNVPVSKSISLIEQLLVQAGAQHISKTYDNQNVTGFTFQIDVRSKINPNPMPMIFKLPSKADTVEKAMLAQVKRAQKDTVDRVKAQAHRTAWKLLYEWVAIQMSMIKLEQVEILEVFLPYYYDMSKDETFYERILQSGNKLLTEGK